MSTAHLIMESIPETTAVRQVDTKLEVVVIPVSDVDRAKDFYCKLGWRLDAEFADGETFRVLQFTPPGSPASIIFGKGVTRAVPGSAQGLYLIVSDVEAARDELNRRGVEVSDVFHGASGVYAPSYTRLDLFASYDVTDRASLQLNVKNATDEEYIMRTNGVHHADPAPTSQAILTLNVRF